MSAIEFVIRTRAGAIQRGSVGGENEEFLIDAGQNNDISLNIRQSDLRGYDRAGSDLLITLADGRVIVLEGYFDAGDNRLFLSSEGILNEVTFSESEGGALFAQYGPTETWGKWSPSDELIFMNDPQVVADLPLGAYDGEGEEVSMAAAAGLLGLGGAGAAGMGAAGLAGLGLLGLGGGGGGGNGDGEAEWTPPTVDDPDSSHSIGGKDDKSLTITGTANPGSKVTIVIDGKTVEGTSGDDGKWSLKFDGDDFPGDGNYKDVQVKVEDPSGRETILDGPSFVIDTTPPPIDVTDGAVSTGDLFNGEAHAKGVVLSGNGEAGAKLTIQIESYTQTITIGDNGKWSFNIDASVLPAGEYTKDVTLITEDGFGNSFTKVEKIQIDTVNTIDLTNDPLTGDNLISGAEHTAGVTFTGTSQVGSTVVVTIEGQSHTVVTGADGSWSVTFSKSELRTGTYDAQAKIVSTDTAGNVVQTTHDFKVDTDVAVTVNTSTIEGDGLINAAENANGSVLTGTAEAGSTVTVKIDGLRNPSDPNSTVGTTLTTKADASGNWSVDIPQGVLARGEYDVTATVTAVDPAGNTASASGKFRVDTETTVTLDTTGVGGDGVVNASEHAGMVTIKGTAEANATVEFKLNGKSWTTTADASGNWSRDINGSDLPTGENKTVLVEVKSTDAAGNEAMAISSFKVDTENAVTVNDHVTSDGVINASERATGVVLSGTGDAGSSISVNIGAVGGASGGTLTTTVSIDGKWSVNIPSAWIPQGNDVDVPVIASSTDAAGNTVTANGTLDVDTVTNVAIVSDSTGRDRVINASERANGVTVSGTSEAGASVDVSVGGVKLDANDVRVAADGSWTATIDSGRIPTGERTNGLRVTATATDAAGNTDTATSNYNVDTVVNQLSANTVAGDNVINSSEAANGFQITGRVEESSTVTVQLFGKTYDAIVTGTTWAINVGAGDIPQGIEQNNVPITITAVDAYGNSRLENGNLAQLVPGLKIDTEVPVAPNWTGEVEVGSNVGGILIDQNVTLSGGKLTLDGSGDEMAFYAYDDNAANVQLNQLNVASTGNIGGHQSVGFNTTVPDGTHLVMATTDDAGNKSGTVLITDDTSNVSTMTDQIAQALGAHNVNVIDLNEADTTSLTITESQIKAMTGEQNTLRIEGNLNNSGTADDTVTIRGAQRTGSQTENGRTYNEYSLGDTTIYIDTDVNVDTSVI